MEGLYEVFFGMEAVGKAEVRRNGLYLHICCRCRINNGEILRLYWVWDDRRESLGVLVPEKGGLVLEKKIPVKRMGQGRCRFLVSGGKMTETGNFYPITPEEPFRYIDRLKNGFLDSEQGKIGLRTGKRPEAS